MGHECGEDKIHCLLSKRRCALKNVVPGRRGHFSTMTASLYCSLARLVIRHRKIHDRQSLRFDPFSSPRGRGVAGGRETEMRYKVIEHKTNRFVARVFQNNNMLCITMCLRAQPRKGTEATEKQDEFLLKPKGRHGPGLAAGGYTQ